METVTVLHQLVLTSKFYLVLIQTKIRTFPASARACNDAARIALAYCTMVCTMWFNDALCKLAGEILAVVQDNIIIMGRHFPDHFFTFKERITTRASHCYKCEHTCSMDLVVRETGPTL